MALTPKAIDNAAPEPNGKGAVSRRALTPKQQMFVTEYLIDLNGAAAARRAGYATKNADDLAAQLLRKTHVAAAIQEAMNKRVARVEIEGDRILQELAHMALYDPADIAGGKVAGPADIANLPENVRRAIIGWGWDRQGNFVLKLSPKTPSLELLGRHLKLWKDVGSQDNPLTELTQEQIDSQLAALLTKVKA